MANTQSEAERERALGAGDFYGSIEAKREQCDAIFTDLRHAISGRIRSSGRTRCIFVRLAFHIRTKLGRAACASLKLKSAQAGATVWRSARRRSIWLTTIAKADPCSGSE